MRMCPRKKQTPSSISRLHSKWQYQGHGDDRMETQLGEATKTDLYGFTKQCELFLN